MKKETMILWKKSTDNFEYVAEEVHKEVDDSITQRGENMTI